MHSQMTNPALMRQRQHADMFRVAVIVLLAVSALVGCAPSEPENPGTPPRASLVTTDQYLNSLSYVFGPSIDLEVLFPPLERTHGLLANGAAIAGVTNSQGKHPGEIT